jgi:hypothetical protein
VYVDARYGGNAAATSHGFLPPLHGFIDEIRHPVSNDSVLARAWNLGYLGLMLAGIGVAVTLVRRNLTAVSFCASLFGLSLLVLVFGDAWSYTRLSSPLFAALLLCGLERRARLAPVLCAVASAMTVSITLALTV